LAFQDDYISLLVFCQYLFLKNFIVLLYDD